MTSATDTRENRTFVSIVCVALAFKLWATSTIAVTAYYAPYDYSDFLENAKSLLLGQWFGTYTNGTLIKGPGIELYLAAIHQFGIPLPLAHQLIYASASLLAIVAVRPLIRSGWLLGLLYCAILFSPSTFDITAWVLNRSQIMSTLSLMFAACGVGAVVRSARGIGTVAVWMAGTGFAASGIWLTREDTVWVFPSLVAFLIIYVAALAFDGHAKSLGRILLVAIPPAILVASVLTIMAINGSVYGWSTTVETTSPEFASAYQSLTRIIVPGFDNRVYPAPEAAREEAYAVSEAAAELKPHFDNTHAWQQTSCATLSLCADISAGWFLWAFRDAVSDLGYYATGKTARNYYVRLSRELDEACDAGKLRCRRKSLGLAPALQLSDIPGTLRYAFEALWHSAAYDQFAAGRIPLLSTPAEALKRDYQNVVGSAAGSSYVYIGWLAHERRGSIHLESPVPTDFLNVEFGPSGDIRAALGSSPEFRNDDLDKARFVISTSCAAKCFLVVDDGPGRLARIPLEAATTDFRAPGIDYHLDSGAMDPPVFAGDASKTYVLAQIAQVYQQSTRWWVVFVAILVLVRCVRALRAKRPIWMRRVYLVTLGIALTLFAHALVLGIVSAVSFYALYPEYESSLFPLLLFCLAVPTAVEGEIVYRFVLRKSTVKRHIPGATSPGRG